MRGIDAIGRHVRGNRPGVREVCEGSRQTGGCAWGEHGGLWEVLGGKDIEGRGATVRETEEPDERGEGKRGELGSCS